MLPWSLPSAGAVFLRVTDGAARIVAARALDFQPDEASAARRRKDPLAISERWFVADVLGVAAPEVRDPGARLIGIGSEADDGGFHGARREGDEGREEQG